MSYGREYYGSFGRGFRPHGGGMARGYDRNMGSGAEQPGRFHGGMAWGGFRHMNSEELRAGAPRRIERAAREGYTGYGGYPGPRRSERWGRYDLGYRRGYDRGW
jgi:hypothetical protein